MQSRAMKWYVYILIDPCDGLPFYVGLTRDPKKRNAAHTADWGSKARTRCQEIKSSGSRHEMEVIAQFDSRTYAAQYEQWLICDLGKSGNLLNTHFNGGRRAG